MGILRAKTRWDTWNQRRKGRPWPSLTGRAMPTGYRADRYRRFPCGNLKKSSFWNLECYGHLSWGESWNAIGILRAREKLECYRRSSCGISRYAQTGSNRGINDQTVPNRRWSVLARR